MSAEGDPIIDSPPTLVVPRGALDPRATARKEPGGLLTYDRFSIISELWKHGGHWSGWSQSYGYMTVLQSSTFTGRSSIWTALTNKANGNALKDANTMSLNLF
jgi:hypothetical protein